MKEYFRKPSASILLAIFFSAWVGVIFYNHYPRLWQAIRDPVATAKIIPPRYMNLGVARAGLLILAVLVAHFSLGYLLSLRPTARLKGHQKLAVSVLATGLVLGLAWSLYRYPKLLDAGVNLALLLMVVLISSFAGRRLLHVLGAKSDSSLEEFVFSAGLGLGLFTYAILALAFLGLLHAWLVWLILVVLGIALFQDIWCSIKNHWKRLSRLFTVGFSMKNRAADILLISLISIYLLINLIGALAPEIEPDSLVYHLYVPRVYIQNHRLVYVPYEFRAAFPLGMEMLFTLAMLLSNSALAKLFHFSMGVLSLLATYCFGRKYVGSRVGLLAATIFYTVSVVGWSSTTAYIDLGTTFFSTLEIFALVNWWHSRRDKWLAVAAIMCGLAMGTKYLGVFGLVILIAAILLKPSFTGKRDILVVSKTVLIYAFVSVLLVSPWLMRNYVFTRNPVYPLLNNVFKSPLMPPINPAFDRASFGMGDDVLTKYILSPWNMTFHGEKYGGVIGPIFLIFLPLLLVMRVDRAIGYLLLFCGIFFILWGISFPIIRYLMPIMPFLSIIVSYVINNIVGGGNRGNAVLSTEVMAVTAVTLFLNLPFFHPLWQEGWSPGIVRQIPYEVVLGIESREHYLSRHLSSYEVFQYVNHNLPPDAKILCFNEEFRYLSDRTLVPVFSFEARNVVSSRDVGELLRYMKDLEVTHFLVNWAAVQDTQRDLLILQDSFIDRHLDLLYRNESVVLYKLSFEALPLKDYVWQEGESLLSQSGSDGLDFKAPASNNQCLGMGWGGNKNDFVEYEVSIPRDLPSPVLFIRYAREGQTDAALNVYFDGELVGTSPSMRLPPTGGWGYEADEWAYQELPFGSIDEGEHKVKFISQVDGGVVNIDGFFIADSPFHPPDDVHHIRGV
jgi:4-amino-4-deoxy-L-arabinose transferase-like glycosyltransferase